MNRLERKAKRELRGRLKRKISLDRSITAVRAAPGSTWWRGHLHPTIRRVSAVVAKVPDDGPWGFQAPLAGQTIKVVEVVDAQQVLDGYQTIYLYDHDGSGWEFVTTRRGIGEIPMRILIDSVVSSP